MYLGIDIGGTKTLVAAFSNEGVIQSQIKFPTPVDYDDFLKQLANTIAEFTTHKYTAVGVGLPATELDREKGVGISFSNLPWRNVHIKKDIEDLTNVSVVIENDAKLAGLSEASNIQTYSKVLYITVSTGIGTALIVDRKIDTAIGDAGGATIMVDHNGKNVPWESFASGKAIVKRFGKRAEDIHDEKAWKTIAANIAIGLIDVIAMTEPDVIVIGGGVGAYLPRFSKPLTAALKRYDSPLLPIPPILEAKRPNEAVIYGCYELAKAMHG